MAGGWRRVLGGSAAGPALLALVALVAAVVLVPVGVAGATSVSGVAWYASPPTAGNPLSVWTIDFVATTAMPTGATISLTVPASGVLPAACSGYTLTWTRAKHAPSACSVIGGGAQAVLTVPAPIPAGTEVLVGIQLGTNPVAGVPVTGLTVSTSADPTPAHPLPQTFSENALTGVSFSTNSGVGGATGVTWTVDLTAAGPYSLEYLEVPPGTTLPNCTSITVSDSTAGWTGPPSRCTTAYLTGRLLVVFAPHAPATGDHLSIVCAGVTNPPPGTPWSGLAVWTAVDNSPAFPETGTLSATVPGAPSVTTSAAGDHEVTVGWTAPATVGGSPISSYVVTAAGPGGTSSVLAAASARTATVGGLVDGDTYAVTVAAVNGIGTGTASPAVDLVPRGVPVAPTGLRVTAGIDGVQLSWTPVPAGTDGGSPVTGYAVQLSPPCPSCTGLTPAGTSTTVSGLAGGTTYAVRIAAITSSGTGAATPSVSVTPPAPSPPTPTPGYWLVTPTGHVDTVGAAPFLGDVGNVALDQPIEAMAATPDHRGYWLVAADGGVFAYGDAGFYGSMGGSPLDAPIVGIAPTPDGEGYWLVAADGGVFAYGDAQFHGSMGGHSLDRPVVAMAPTPSGHGYWLVAADGGVFSFGDAGFYGSMGGRPLNRPVVAMTTTGSAHGYWLVAADGGVFAFGDAAFSGSLGGQALRAPVVAAMFDTAGGYWLVSSAGTPVPFGVAALPAPPTGLEVAGAALCTP